MSDKITKAELEQQYHMLQEEYGRLSNEHRELKAKYDGCTHELEGVRGALKREAEMRTKADEELKDWKSRYNVLVRGLEYKSRVQYSSEDKIKELEKDLESMTNSRNWNADEAARLRRWYDNLKKLYDKARKEGEEGCAMWREDSWKNRDERDHYKKIYEAAARKNDELQCEVNRLTQKVQDFEKRLPGTYLALPRPDDEICGRKIKEWMGYHAVLVKYGIPSPESLDAKLDPFEPARLTATRSYNVMVKYGINDEKELDESLERLERFQQMLRDWHFRTIDEFSTYVNELHNYKIVCQQNLIGSTDELKKSFDELKTFRLSRSRSLGKEWRDVVDRHHVFGPDDLDRRLTLQEKYQEAAYDIQKSKGFKWLSDYIYGGAND